MIQMGGDAVGLLDCPAPIFRDLPAAGSYLFLISSFKPLSLGRALGLDPVAHLELRGHSVHVTVRSVAYELARLPHFVHLLSAVSAVRPVWRLLCDWDLNFLHSSAFHRRALKCMSRHGLILLPHGRLVQRLHPHLGSCGRGTTLRHLQRKQWRVILTFDSSRRRGARHLGHRRSPTLRLKPGRDQRCR